LQLINPSTSPNELNTTLTPHSIIHGDACFAYFNKIWGIPGYCSGVVQAILSLLHMKDLCWEGMITNEQAVRVVIKYIEARPERMHEPFIKLVQEALIAAWPCKR
jgi:hypothetical protein